MAILWEAISCGRKKREKYLVLNLIYHNYKSSRSVAVYREKHFIFKQVERIIHILMPFVLFKMISDR